MVDKRVNLDCLAALEPVRKLAAVYAVKHAVVVMHTVDVRDIHCQRVVNGREIQPCRPSAALVEIKAEITGAYHKFAAKLELAPADRVQRLDTGKVEVGT